MIENYDVCIIGGGAAGLFCGFNTASTGKSVLILEHSEKIGKKILISGGGRCNFTNLVIKPERYISKNPHFHKSAFARYGSEDFIELIKKHKIAYHEKTLGQLFCDKSAREIVTMLLDECKQQNVEIRVGITVRSIRKSDLFIIETDGSVIHARNVVIACGGTAIPLMGATDFGLRIARQFGLSIETPYPALVPLLFSQSDKHWTELAGVSLHTSVSMEDISFQENILFTHKGLSGPAILQISSYCKGKKPFFINLLSESGIDDIFNNQTIRDQLFSTVLTTIFPQRFAKKFCEYYNINKPLKQFSLKEKESVKKILTDWEITPNGTEGYAKAEVMAGGVSTDELSSKTMESKRVPGLYFIGEVVDVTGWLGGYNFQWAWSSAYAAAHHLQSKFNDN